MEILFVASTSWDWALYTLQRQLIRIVSSSNCGWADPKANATRSPGCVSMNSPQCDKPYRSLNIMHICIRFVIMELRESRSLLEVWFVCGVYFLISIFTLPRKASLIKIFFFLWILNLPTHSQIYLIALNPSLTLICIRCRISFAWRGQFASWNPSIYELFNPLSSYFAWDVRIL